MPWDSATFGISVVEARLPATPNEQVIGMLARMVDEIRGAYPSPILVSAKIPIASVTSSQALCAQGFYPIETMLEVYHGTLGRFDSVTPAVEGVRLRQAGPTDVPRLIELATGSFFADRFHIEPHLALEWADRRFAGWVERAVTDGDLVYCYDDRMGQTIGFFHVRPLSPHRVDLSLAAIDRHYQRLGIGLLMYQAVLLDLKSRNYRVAESHISVHNTDVLNLFARLGFQFRRPVLTMHLYIGPPALD